MVVQQFALVALLARLVVEATLEQSTTSTVNETDAKASELHGDLLLTNRQLALLKNAQQVDANPYTRSRSIIRNFALRWPNNIVYYSISPQYSSSERNLIKVAMRDLEDVSCFRFKKRNSQSCYVQIEPQQGCFSQLGRVGGRQILSLARQGCMIKSTIQHELMHAVGVIHEHQRPDRDEYLRINWQNIQPGAESQFEKMPSSLVTTDGLHYEYDSIMHYYTEAFSRDGRSPVMVPKKGPSHIGTNSKLTRGDIKKLIKLGECRDGDIGKDKKKGGKRNDRDSESNSDERDDRDDDRDDRGNGRGNGRGGRGGDGRGGRDGECSYCEWIRNGGGYGPYNPYDRRGPYPPYPYGPRPGYGRWYPNYGR